MNLDKLLKPYRIDDGKGFSLGEHDPTDTGELDIDKSDAEDYLEDGIEKLAELQHLLYAQDRWSVLLIFQAMDAAGKDSSIKHVMSGINPQGVQVFSFKQPSSNEIDHDFLWRTTNCLPQRGKIGIFNRSYYEEVLVVRVHKEILETQKLPARLLTPAIFEERLTDIANFESYLARQGTLVLKFFLNVSQKEQKKRFMDRLDEPEKHWKFSPADLKERLLWDDYMHAYQETIRTTASPLAPWYVVPADHKWFTRIVVAGAIIQGLQGLDMHYPTVPDEELENFKKYRKELKKG